ncbi:reticulon-4b [Danio rerio]|uniref:Reticulon n=1 Tax=Danio rerio TaxID=7955 RepID=Q4G5V0_DANRE|nr:reticulon-4b [Danio rerio]AAT64120.1 reticulon 6-a1 [Danio rerio]|eukprot:NP_001035425.1 reticulon 4b [Danio rerio]
MEDTERASSAALGSAPHEESGNEASAAGKTRADEPLLDAEETRDEQVTEVTSTQQITEVNTAPQTAEVTSAEQITEVTSAEQTSLTPTTEVNTAQQTAEVTLTNVSAEQITEADPQITEQTDISLTQTTVVTSPEQVTEVTSTSPEHVTEVKADPHITEVTQITEDTSLTLPTEATSPEQVTEVRVDPQITEVTSSTQVTEETSLTQITEVTSPEQVSELKPDPQISEETLTQTAGVTSVSPEPITEITSAEQTSEETSLTQISEDVTEETSVPPVSGPPPPPPHHPAAAAPPPDRSLAPCNARPPEPCGEPHSELPPAGEPEVSVSVFQTLPSERCRSLVSSAGLAMDAFGREPSATSDPDLLSPSDDDLMLEMKSSAGLEESRSVSDSPSPDLLQDAYEDLQTPGALSAAEPPNPEQRPVALPDILQSSPLNPEKLDSGSSEGSPDCSPAHRCSPNPPLSAAGSPDSRILLLREMVEETEARAVEKVQQDVQQEVQQEAQAQLEKQVQQESQQGCTVLDLLQEAPAHTQTLPPPPQQQTDAPAELLQGLQFSSGPHVELWDSSPSADSFSPVLDAEQQKHSENTHSHTHIDAADEEQEPSSSEEFEFVERPAAGAAEEFVELQDGLTSITAPPPEAAEAPEQKQSSTCLLSPAEGGGPADGEERSDVQQTCPAGHTAGAPADPTAVLQLLYWRDVRASALVLGSLLLLLLFLSCCSVISVLSYSALCLLTLTLSTRVFTAVLQAMRKTEDGHPFRQYLERDVLLSADAVHTHSEALLRRINTALVELRRLFLVEDLVDSLKLAVGLWLLTYVGSWFNGLTLLIIALIGAFSGPIAYERHQSEIDQFISMINTQMREALGKVLAMVPGGKKKSD